MTRAATAVVSIAEEPPWQGVCDRSPAVTPLRRLESEYDTRLRAARGEPDAWDVLVDRYLPFVWTSALAETADEAGAVGVCEIVWLRLADALPGLPDEHLTPWLERTVAQEAARLRPRLAPQPRVQDGGAPAA